MPQRPKVDRMPKPVRDWLDRVLADGSHDGYHALAAELRSRGVEISHAAVHRYDQKVQRRIAAIRAATEAARLIASSLPDGRDDMSGAVTTMVQQAIFDQLVQLQEAAEETDPHQRLKLLASAAKAASDLTRAKIAHRRWQDEVRERMDAAEKAGGLSADARAAIREVLGIQ